MLYPGMLCASQSQVWEAMLSQHAMQSKTLSITEPARTQKDKEEKVETSLVPYPRAIGKPLNISAQNNYRLLWFLSVSFQ